jgi:enoyl-CoA hydratase
MVPTTTTTSSVNRGPVSPVLVGRSGRLGRITLNRPKALNALTLEMVQGIGRALTDFEAAAEVTTVLIDGAGDRGLCAGGDIRAFYEAMLRGDPAPRRFWREEYRLNARIARYPKPIVVIMDGIVMGGGVGIAAHATLRVVTERTTVAMPEVGIGFAPDVGSTWLLARAPGELGTHLALTAARLGAADAIACGLAGYYAPTSSLPALIRLLEIGDAYHALDRMGEPPPIGSTLRERRSWIDECYRVDTVEEIVRRLRETERADAQAAADEIVSKSPTAVKVTLRALRAARSLRSIEACLDMEYGISTTFLDTPDFVEGVRAAIIDKDRTPHWTPDRLEWVTDEMVSRFFGSRGLGAAP